MKVPGKDNKREFTRAVIHIPTDLTSGGKKIHGEARDVSLRGMFFFADEDLPEKTDCRIEIFLAGSSLSICAGGRIARVFENGMGIEFTEVDIDSFERLRNMIRMNTGDISQVEGEFKEHLGLRSR